MWLMGLLLHRALGFSIGYPQKGGQQAAKVGRYLDMVLHLVLLGRIITPDLNVTARFPHLHGSMNNANQGINTG